MMGQRRSSEGAGYWQGVIGKQESSGMSAVAFCREHDVPESSFYNGKRKLKQRRREDDSTRIGKATSPGITRSGATRKNSTVKFVRSRSRHDYTVRSRLGVGLLLR